MANSREKSLGEQVNTWVQISAIIATAAWAIYTFVYKEITVPKSAPVNITLNLKLKKVGVGDIKDIKSKKPLAVVEMNVSAKNPSSLTIHLLPSVFIIYGTKITDSPVGDNELLEPATPISSASKLFEVKHWSAKTTSVVAIGNLLDNPTDLKPSELVMRTLVFYVPVGEYDLLEAQALIPCAKDVRGIDLEWNLEEDGRLVPTIFRIDGDGKRLEAIKRDKDGKYSDERRGLDTAKIVSMISLW